MIDTTHTSPGPGYSAWSRSPGTQYSRSTWAVLLRPLQPSRPFLATCDGFRLGESEVLCPTTNQWSRGAQPWVLRTVRFVVALAYDMFSNNSGRWASPYL